MSQKFKLWSNWTINCAIGELLGIACAGTIAFYSNSLIGEPIDLEAKLLVLFAMMFAGFIEGAILSHFQWKVLVTKFSKIPQSEWFLYTTLVAILGWFLGMLPSLFIMSSSNNKDGVVSTLALPDPLLFLALSIGAGLILGAIFGLFQWFSFRKHTNNAHQWIIANSLGWGLGLAWIYVFASIPQEDSSLSFIILMGIIGGTLTGLSVGAITGIFLVRMDNIQFGKHKADLLQTKYDAF